MNTYQIDITAEAIREVQRYLLELSYAHPEIPHVEIDGIYGTETADAVRAFQRLFILPVTGEADFPTFTLLYEKFLIARDERLGESEMIPAFAFPLHMGDSGSYVRILQSALDEILGAHIPADGFFGRTTEEGVKQLQGKAGLPQDGAVSRLFWRTVVREYREAVRKKIHG